MRKGKLADALDGLKYLCSLPNMETHADLIAGLPLYHLEQIFEDIRTLADYKAGEIQLESLKLLPGTYMRQHAAELGICYSTYPPYEVLRTNEITTADLQTARRLSRLLDAFYNTPSNHKDKTEVKQKTKVVTYSLKEDNVKYVELRATHFGSKSGFLNHLIEEDMKQHPDIVEMAAALSSMKE